MKHTLARCVFISLMGLPVVHAQSAAAIVAKHLKALGHAERLEAIQSLHFKLRVQIASQKGYIEGWFIHEQGSIIIKKFSPRHTAELLNKAGKWQQLSHENSIRKVEVQIDNDNLQVNSYFAPLYLLNYTKRGMSLSLSRIKERVNGTKCYVIRSKPHGAHNKQRLLSARYYIGMEDFLLYQVRHGGVTEKFTDYVPTQEIMVPNKHIRAFPFRGGEKNILSKLLFIEINPHFPPDMFTLAGFKRLLAKHMPAE